ncbi:MAG: hypothetical protein F4Y22_06710, partial [Gammaproteobacteria bacterium]|nr:hypothetical protein [Gammaproteobacteria bacterium]
MNTKISSIFPLNINAIIQQLLGKENYNQITNDMLHCSSLCGLKMAPKLRNALMSATKELTIPCLLEELLSNGTGSRGNKFNLTSRQRLEVERAYNAFNTLRQDSTANGRPLTDRLAWIIPDKHFHKNGSIRRDIHHEIYTEIKKYSGLTAYE